MPVQRPIHWFMWKPESMTTWIPGPTKILCGWALSATPVSNSRFWATALTASILTPSKWNCPACRAVWPGCPPSTSNSCSSSPAAPCSWMNPPRPTPSTSGTMAARPPTPATCPTQSSPASIWAIPTPSARMASPTPISKPSIFISVMATIFSTSTPPPRALKPPWTAAAAWILSISTTPLAI